MIDSLPTIAGATPANTVKGMEETGFTGHNFEFRSYQISYHWLTLIWQVLSF